MIILVLALLCLMFYIGFKLTGALLSALFWVFVKLPAALVVWFLGIICFCTVLLIPVGRGLFRLGARILR